MLSAQDRHVAQDIILYPIQASGPWYAARVDRQIEVRDKRTDEIITRLTPPENWLLWDWNVASDSKGVYFHKRREPYAWE